jgi:opacity protein-like surface antigen
MRQVLGVLALVMLTLPAVAATPEMPNEIAVFVGHFRGDELTEFDRSPILDDDISFGVHWKRLFEDVWPGWGMMGRFSYVAGDVTNLAGGADVGMDVVFSDLSLLYQWDWDWYSVYIPFGIGYAVGDLDRALVTPDRTAAIGADSDFTYHVGLGLSWHLGEMVNINFEGRYRIAGELVDSFGDTADVYETSLGLGWMW